MQIFFLIFSFLIFKNSVNTLPQEKILKITILYDNYVIEEGTESEWGFSCLIEGLEKTILFDTGTKPDILLKNADTLGIDLNKIDLLVLSHSHRDHTGGMVPVLEKNPAISVYTLPSFPPEINKVLKDNGAKIIPVWDEREICKHAYLTGEMGTDIKEQSLIIETPEGLVVITGCSHQGILNIIEKAKKYLQKDIYMVFGGFHLLRHSEKDVERIVQQFRAFGVQKCGPTHCTGDKAISIFKENYGKDYIPMGVGKIIKIPLDI